VTSPSSAVATLGKRFALTRDQWTVFLFVQLWLFLLLRGWTLFLDPGTFWHIVTGDRILSSGLPQQDWMSFTRAGAPWVAHQWLGEVAMALLHRVGSFDALLVTFSASFALLFAWLFRRLAGCGVTPAGSLAAMLLALAASQHHWHARPHVVSMFLFAWLYARLVDFEAGRIRARRLLELVPMFVLWSNVHGGAMGGLATLALVAGGWIGAWALGRPSPVRDARSAALIAALAVACIATVVVNPYGLELPRTWSRIMGSPELARLMEEHQPFWVARSWLALGLLVAYLAAFATTRWRALQVTSLASVAWFALGIERTRHLPLFAVAALLSMPDLLRHSRFGAIRRRLLPENGLDPAPKPAAPGLRWLLVAPIAVLLGVVIVHQATPAPRRAEPRFVTLNVERWPRDLLPDLIRAQDGLPPGSPILNDMMFGGFLAYYAPGLRIAIDDRWELYGDDFVVSYVERMPAWFNRWILPAGPRLALVRPGSRLDLLLAEDPSWERTATGVAAVLYRRSADRPMHEAPVATATSLH
jgi:hypothetical protein